MPGSRPCYAGDLTTSREAEQTFRELTQQLPLASHWGQPEFFVDTARIEGLELCSVGLLAKSSRGGDVTGSAAEEGQFPVRRAYFELIERAALWDALRDHADSGVLPLWNDREERVGESDAHSVFPVAPAGADWAYARSNGVAAGPDWRAACRSAHAELLERHYVLSAWYGFTTPRVLSPDPAPELAALGSCYDFASYEFPRPAEEAPEHSLCVAGLFGFPKASQAPLIYGLGAASALESARARARAECLQRLGFLWGEELPTEEPPFEATAAYHQELYLWPPMRDKLQAWLGGAHVGRAGVRERLPRAAPRFADLTPPHLAERLRVVKAIPSAELPLTFGKRHPLIDERGAALGVHFIA